MTNAVFSLSTDKAKYSVDSMKRQHEEIDTELKQALSSLSSLSNYILEEKDLNSNAKNIIKRVVDVVSILSTSVLSAKSLHDNAFGIATVFKDRVNSLGEVCVNLKLENDQLRYICQKPDCVDQGTITDECFELDKTKKVQLMHLT